MNRISVKLLSVLAIILFIAVIPIVTLAANEEISIISKTIGEKQEYIIYIKDYTNQKFKYAFTTNANPQEMDLSYINSISDLRGNQSAFLDAETYEKLSNENQTIFIWAKDQNQNLILHGIQLDLNQILTEEKLETVETVTKRIQVKIGDSQEETKTVRNENIDGVDEIANVGYVEIIDDEKADYYYQKIKLPNSEEYNRFMELSEQIKNEYDEMDMYSKVQLGTEFNELYSKITSEAQWEAVEDMIIEQPEASVSGDKYIVLLKKVGKKEETTLDVQFLTAFDNYTPNVIKEEIITHETTKLPITYDNIALFVILGIIVILVIAVFIRIKILKNRNEE